ncbi:Vinorine synthase [Morella rubra]|uniref:Vinorine synthase n=1 Tax=Morella rubra TaxID=262757 RepID=A0A6A1WH61_9ROSI|nr:Vinorine synthase [Morella rubra]
MAVMNVQIISKEMIKPSSPTPHHLRNFKLSFLDQIAPPCYIPVIFFYRSKQDHQNVDQFERSCLLKKSLAETLTRLYPLAGMLVDQDFYVDCNDEGVEYIQAQVPCKLAEVLQKPNVGNDLVPLLPFTPYHGFTELGKKVLLAVQYNSFDCGGVAIGVVVSHKIADGTSMGTFVNAWAGTSRGSTAVINPSFNAATHFPPVETSGFVLGKPMEKIVTRRFVFDKSSIDALRKEGSVAFGPTERGPSRVEAVSAFMWKRFMAVTRSNPEKNPKLYGGLHAVNLRERMVPQLPAHTIGNLYQTAVTTSPVEIEKDYPSLVRQLRNAIMAVNTDTVKKLHDASGYLGYLKNAVTQLSEGETEFFNFTSWCRFPVYEVDFGWGKPTWVCSPGRPYKNVVVLMSTRDGDGIEAWVNMKEEDMPMFEHDPELLPFAP